MKNFFFEWQDGKWDYEVIGNRSGKKFLLNFTPTNKGLNIKVTCKDGSYYSWQTGRKGIDWINAEYGV